MINSQISIDNNAIAAKKISDKYTGEKKSLSSVRAPEHYPTYDFEKISRQKDEFIKSVYLDSYKNEKRTKTKTAFFSLLKTVLYVTGVYIAISKIKFKK